MTGRVEALRPLAGWNPEHTYWRLWHASVENAQRLGSDGNQQRGPSSRCCERAKPRRHVQSRRASALRPLGPASRKRPSRQLRRPRAASGGAMPRLRAARAAARQAALQQRRSSCSASKHGLWATNGAAAMAVGKRPSSGDMCDCRLQTDRRVEGMAQPTKSGWRSRRRKQ